VARTDAEARPERLETRVCRDRREARESPVVSAWTEIPDSPGRLEIPEVRDFVDSLGRRAILGTRALLDPTVLQVTHFVVCVKFTFNPFYVV